MHLRLSDFDFEVVQQADVQRQAADSISRLQANGKDEYLLEADLPILMIAEVQQEEGKKKAEAKLLAESPVHEGLDTVEPALPEVLQVSVRRNQQRNTAFDKRTRD